MRESTRPIDKAFLGAGAPLVALLPGATMVQNFVTAQTIGPALGAYGVSRASTAYEDDAGGQWYVFGNNVLRNTTKGELSEESRTNVQSNNTYVGGAAGTLGGAGSFGTGWSWLDGGLGVAGSISFGTENGLPYAEVALAGTPSATGQITIVMPFASNAASNGQTWTTSIFGKLLSGAWSQFAYAGLSGDIQDAGHSYLASPGFGNLNVIGSSITRVVNTFTIANASTAFIAGGLALGCTISVPINIRFRIYAAQWELGAFATSPILTANAGAITRAADVVQLTAGNFSSWFGSTVAAQTGTLFAQFLIPSPGALAQFICDISDGGANNELFFAVNNTNQVQFQSKVAGVTQASIFSTAKTVGQRIKAAAAWDAAGSDFAFYVNGVQAGVSASGTVPIVNSLQLGCRAGGVQQSNTYAERLEFSPTRVANGTLAAVTT